MNSRAPLRAPRAMRAVPVGDDVALPGSKDDLSSVAKLGDQLSFEDEHDVAALAPVVRDVAGGVVDHPDPDVARLLRPPGGHARLAGVRRRLHGGPVGRLEGDAFELHRRRPRFHRSRALRPASSRAPDARAPACSDACLQASSAQR